VKSRVSVSPFIRYYRSVPERLCEVTVVDCYGVRRTIEVKARSTYAAACYYYSRSRANPTERLPQSNDATVYEVKIVGEQTVYRVNHRRMMEWANREAAKVARRK
jgi:hypothetical protein